MNIYIPLIKNYDECLSLIEFALNCKNNNKDIQKIKVVTDIVYPCIERKDRISLQVLDKYMKFEDVEYVNNESIIPNEIERLYDRKYLKSILKYQEDFESFILDNYFFDAIQFNSTPPILNNERMESKLLQLLKTLIDNNVIFTSYWDNDLIYTLLSERQDKLDCKNYLKKLFVIKENKEHRYLLAEKVILLDKYKDIQIEDVSDKTGIVLMFNPDAFTLQKDISNIENAYIATNNVQKAKDYLKEKNIDYTNFIFSEEYSFSLKDTIEKSTDVLETSMKIMKTLVACKEVISPISQEYSNVLLEFLLEHKNLNR